MTASLTRQSWLEVHSVIHKARCYTLILSVNIYGHAWQKTILFAFILLTSENISLQVICNTEWSHSLHYHFSLQAV